MKEKYVYVVFNNSSAKYLYLHPSFKVESGYFVELETTNTISQGYIYKVVKFSEKTLPYPKEKLRNIISVIDKNCKENLKNLNPNLQYFIKKNKKEIAGWKKVTNTKKYIVFDYKSKAYISIFHDKSDGMFFINCTINNFVSFETDTYNKKELDYKVYNIKKAIKSWYDGEFDEGDIFRFIGQNSYCIIDKL